MERCQAGFLLNITAFIRPADLGREFESAIFKEVLLSRSADTVVQARGSCFHAPTRQQREVYMATSKKKNKDKAESKPAKPKASDKKNGELSDADLDKVAGGGSVVQKARVPGPGSQHNETLLRAKTGRRRPRQ